MNTVIIVQARMSSTRLPGKVMLPLSGRPMLARLIERLKHVQRTDLIVVATTINSCDDEIVQLCEELGVPYHRGSEHDVLSRYAETARKYAADVVVRITADCPLIDPSLIDRIIAIFEQGQYDYVSNMLTPTWPYGMAVEVFSAAALLQADHDSILASEREHVTPFIYWRPERFRLHNVISSVDLSHHRWTVDTPEDYVLVHRLFEHLVHSQPNFTQHDVLALLSSHPEWIATNQHIRQKLATETQIPKENA